MKPKLKSLGILLLSLMISSFIYTSDYLTKAESSNFMKTSLHDDVMDLLYWAQKKSKFIKILTLTNSHEGRMIPLVVISKLGIHTPYELSLTGKSPVLIQANIHAGEVEGKEACLLFIRDIAAGKHLNMLENQVILMIPNFNADGNEKLSPKNRRDNGPELAGSRYNGQFLDLNRDFLKIESPEVEALIRLFNEWDPVLFVDMHTKNGSYHREPVTFTTLSNPNSFPKLPDYMWKKFFPSVQKILKKKFGYDSIPYGNFVERANPQKGWGGFHGNPSAFFSTNYTGLRNRFTVLNENYPHAPFKTRVLSSYGFICSILEYCNKNISEMKKMITLADMETKKNFYREQFVLESKVEKLFDLTIKSYRFTKEKIKPEDRHKYPPWIKDFIVKKTDEEKNYTVPYFAKPVPTRSIPLPQAYLVLPQYKNIIKMLKKHGIIVKRILKSTKINVEEFILKEVKPKSRLFQGHVFINIKGKYKKILRAIPENSFYIPMEQPLARIIAVLLEPEGEDSLVQWGYFNRILVTQWGARPNLYPVFRIIDNIPPLEMIME